MKPSRLQSTHPPKELLVRVVVSGKLPDYEIEYREEHLTKVLLKARKRMVKDFVA